MSVSVIIPAWNAGATLAGTIRSALDQPEVTEIIVIDDGSTDGTAALACTFGARVRVESIPNAGVSNARNLGFRLSNGEWMQFLDADDQLLPGTIASRLRQADMGDVIVTDWLEFSSDRELEAADSLPRRGADWDRVGLEGAEVACAVSFWAPPVAVLYRRSIVEKIGGFRADLPVIQDARHLFDAARRGGRFVHLPQVGAAYRVQAGSLSRRNPVAFLRDVLLNARQIRAEWQADGPIDATRRRALAEMFGSTAHGLFRAGKPEWRDAFVDALAFGKPIRLIAYRALEGVFGLTAATRFLARLQSVRGR